MRNGNVAPALRSAPTFYTASQIASNSSNKDLIVAHLYSVPEAWTLRVDTVAKDFPNYGTPADLYRITWFFVAGLAGDPATKTYFVSSDTGIYHLAEKTEGLGPDNPGGSPKWSPRQLSQITSDTCGTQLAIAHGVDPDVYITHSTAVMPGFQPCPTAAVYVYAYAANGNALPERVLTGVATLLSQPFGIFIGI